MGAPSGVQLAAEPPETNPTAPDQQRSPQHGGGGALGLLGGAVLRLPARGFCLALLLPPPSNVVDLAERRRHRDAAK